MVEAKQGQPQFQVYLVTELSSGIVAKHELYYPLVLNCLVAVVQEYSTDVLFQSLCMLDAPAFEERLVMFARTEWQL